MNSKTSFAPLQQKPFSMLSKPVGAACNLECDYCYYLEKENLYPEKENYKMNDEILEKFIQQYIESQNIPVVSFIWQGGEPCLSGIDFYKKAVGFQTKYSGGKRIYNAFQTNGILLNDEWCEFFADNNFLVGLSIDGPEHLHDKYRTTRSGKPTFTKVILAIELLKKHNVEFNTLTVVNNHNVKYPLEIYNFLKSIGSHFMQFIPVVERIAAKPSSNGLNLVSNKYKNEAFVTDWSVNPSAFGKFLCAIFDEWVKVDVGKYYIQMFDATLANWIGQNPALCMFTPTCGNAGIIEHNGDVYSCDHFVFTDYFLGNINDVELKDLMGSVDQHIFGQNKYLQLPEYCLKCEFLEKCYGECPKKRFYQTPDGEYGLNYLCEGYKHFFKHVTPAMDYMANELLKGRSPATVTRFLNLQ